MRGRTSGQLAPRDFARRAERTGAIEKMHRRGRRLHPARRDQGRVGDLRRDEHAALEAPHVLAHENRPRDGVKLAAEIRSIFRRMCGRT